MRSCSGSGPVERKATHTRRRLPGIGCIRENLYRANSVILGSAPFVGMIRRQLAQNAHGDEPNVGERAR
jgi:hypothetical protein